MNENEISRLILQSAIAVHKTLGGPGLLESVYEESLAIELQYNGLCVKRQVYVPVKYRGHTLATPLRVDLLINEKVIIEAKAVANYNAIFEVQLLTYLRLTGCKLGMVINFGEVIVKNGVHRVVNGL